MSTPKPFPRPPDFPLAPADLQRWLRFSAKGGVGKAKAKVDRVSEDGEKYLMMLEGDEIVVLMDLGGDIYLGHCEGVVGLFRGQDVEFLQAKLKKPVMTPRSLSSKAVNSPTSTKPLSPTINDSLAPITILTEPLIQQRSDKGDEVGSSRGAEEPFKTRRKQQAEDDRARKLNPSSGRQGELEGLGIAVRVEDSSKKMRTLESQIVGFEYVSTIQSPDLAGAFPTALSHFPSTPSVDGTNSPSYSSDSHTVPSLFTSPNSEDTSHSAPRTPYTPASDSSMIWNSKDLPATPSSDQLDTARNEVKDDLRPTLPKDGHSPSSLSIPSNLTTNGLPFPLSRHSLSSSATESSQAPLNPLIDPRLLKSSDSTTASKISQSSTLTSQNSAPNSAPGTPGDDPTLAFIFDSYRYSVTPSLASTGGGVSTVSFPTTTTSPILPTQGVSDMEELDDGRMRHSEVDNVTRYGGKFGAASELRERMRNGEAASALPPHISPTRTRQISNSSTRSSPEVDFPRRSQIFPRSSTSDSLASFSASENGSEHSTPQRRTKSKEGLHISPPALALPSSFWRSHNDSSPVTQVMMSGIDQSTDVFVDSPVSSQSHGHFDGLPPASPPSRRRFEPSDQYLPHPPLSGDSYAPSPSSISFQSSVSTDDVTGSSDHTNHDTSDKTTPNKLRKKSSFRLRKSHSSSRLQLSGSQDPASNPPPPPPLPTHPSRSGSDPFYASSPPSSPARPLNRKNSIGSKFSRKSSEKDANRQRDKEKKVDYGAGISNKDFEEETVQIGANAFEIVKPFAALLSPDLKGEDGNNSSPSVDDHDTASHQYLTTPLRTEFSTPSPHLQQSFSSHFSPPTPLSADGDGRSVEDHRAKESKWVQTLSSGISAAQVRKSKKMRLLIQSGIPSSVRGKVWAFLAEAEKEKKPGLYSHLCSLGSGQYSSAMERDIDSLLIDNPQFAQGSAGREDLVAVLNAFSHFDAQLGYYSGLANLVALLLTQMPAEESLFTLISLVKNYGFRQFFVVGREELRLETIAFSYLLEMVEPKIARKFREFEIGTTDYLFSWLSTFFLSVLPLPTVLRIVDIFLLDPKTRYRAPLAILHLAQYTDTERFPSRDSVLNYLLAPPPTAFAPATLIPALSNYKLSDDKIQKAIKKGAQEMLAPRN